MNVVAIPYAPSWRTAAVGLLICTVMTAGGVSLLRSPNAIADSAVAHVIGTPLSTVCIGVGLLAFLLMAVASAWILVIALRQTRLIVLYDEHFAFPYGWLLTSAATVPYLSITSLVLAPMGHKTILRIVCKHATITVVEAMMPSHRHMQLLYRELAARAKLVAPSA